jgi:hypothetical protein
MALALDFQQVRNRGLLAGFGTDSDKAHSHHCEKQAHGQSRSQGSAPTRPHCPRDNNAPERRSITNSVTDYGPHVRHRVGRPQVPERSRKRSLLLKNQPAGLALAQMLLYGPAIRAARRLEAVLQQTRLYPFAIH